VNATLTDPPLTAAEVLAVLADARTWARCEICGGLHISDTDVHDASWVDTDLHAIESMTKRMEIAAVLDHGHATALKDGLFRVTCTSARAVSIAAHLQHLGVPTNAITIGSSE
jgi:hypothetical protein